MATALRPSWPPPTPRVQPRKPGLRKASPRRLELQLVARECLSGLVAARHVSVRELAECWECPLSHAQDKLDGHRPIHWSEVLALPARFSLEVIRRSETVVLSRAAANLNHR